MCCRYHQVHRGVQQAQQLFGLTCTGWVRCKAATTDFLGSIELQYDVNMVNNVPNDTNAHQLDLTTSTTPIEVNRSLLTTARSPPAFA